MEAADFEAEPGRVRRAGLGDRVPARRAGRPARRLAGAVPHPGAGGPLAGEGTPSSCRSTTAAACARSAARTLNRLLFPAPTKEYDAHREAYGDTSVLSTKDFLYGLEPDDRAHRRAGAGRHAAHRAGGDLRARRARLPQRAGHPQRPDAAGVGARRRRSPPTSRRPRRPSGATPRPRRRPVRRRRHAAGRGGRRGRVRPDRRHHRGHEDGGLDHRAPAPARWAGSRSAGSSRWRAATSCWSWSEPPSRAAIGRRIRMTRIIAGNGGRAATRRAPVGHAADVRPGARGPVQLAGPRPRARRCRRARPVRGVGCARARGAVAGRRARAVRRVRPARGRGAAPQRRRPGAARRRGARGSGGHRAGRGRPTRPYDLVLVDPPYDVPDDEVAGWLADAAAYGWLAPDAMVVVERRAGRGRDGGRSRGRRRWSRCGSGATATRCCSPGRVSRPARPARPPGPARPGRSRRAADRPGAGAPPRARTSRRPPPRPRAAAPPTTRRCPAP